MKKIILIIFTVAIVQLIIQYLDLHHYNAYLDRFLWDTSEFFISLLIVLLLLFISQKIKKPILKYLYLLLPISVSIVCLLMFIKGCVLVTESHHDYTQKMYFHKEGEWNYYARTLRRSALDGLSVFVRREKHFGIGFYLDKIVTYEELKDLGFHKNIISERYLKYYFDSIKIK